MMSTKELNIYGILYCIMLLFYPKTFSCLFFTLQFLSHFKKKPFSYMHWRVLMDHVLQLLSVPLYCIFSKQGKINNFKQNLCIVISLYFTIFEFQDSRMKWIYNSSGPLWPYFLVNLNLILEEVILSFGPLLKEYFTPGYSLFALLCNLWNARIEVLLYGF